MSSQISLCLQFHSGPAAQSVARSTPSSGSQSAIQTEPIPVPRSEARLSLVPCFLLLPRLVDLTRSLRVVQSAVRLLEGLILHLRCLLPVGRSQPPNTLSLQRVPASQHPQPAEGPSLPTPSACRGSQPPNTLSLQRVPASQHPQPAEGPSLPTPSACRGSQPPNTLSLQRVPASQHPQPAEGPSLPTPSACRGSQPTPSPPAYRGSQPSSLSPAPIGSQPTAHTPAS
ncbi:uncharacterized protein AB9X84_007623 [Acanthopagrus schlegelii]